MTKGGMVLLTILLVAAQRQVADRAVASGDLETAEREYRSLVEAEPDLRPVLRRGGFLTRDPRVKESKKYGRKRARRGFQFSKR